MGSGATQDLASWVSGENSSQIPQECLSKELHVPVGHSVASLQQLLCLHFSGNIWYFCLRCLWSDKLFQKLIFHCSTEIFRFLLRPEQKNLMANHIGKSSQGLCSPKYCDKYKNNLKIKLQTAWLPLEFLKHADSGSELAEANCWGTLYLMPWKYPGMRPWMESQGATRCLLSHFRIGLVFPVIFFSPPLALQAEQLCQL